MKAPVAIGLDIGGTNIRIGSQAKDQALMHFEKAARAEVLTSADTGLFVARFIQDYINRHHLSGQVVAIAAGFPSTLSVDRRTILQTPNIANMDLIPNATLPERVSRQSG